MAKAFAWTESFSATVEDDRLVELFEEHCPGKASELLADYLRDNGSSDTELWPILAAFRTQGPAETDDVNDVDYDEV